MQKKAQTGIIVLTIIIVLVLISVVVFWNVILPLIREKSEKVETTEVTFIQREVREVSELGADSVRKYIKALVDYEYLQISAGKRHGTRYCYRLREDKPISELDISIIPTPEMVKRIMEDKNNKT